MTKVGLLTLPLTGNYGGLLQAACLYRAIEELGHTPYLINILLRPKTLRQTILSLLSYFPLHDWRGSKTRRNLKKTHNKFITTYLSRRSNTLFGALELQKAADDLKLDAIVVGSDQVWRFEYQGEDQGLAYFLDINTDIRRIAYAASFGRGEWAYPSRTSAASRLLRRFHTVTVREQSGVTICKDVLGRSDVSLVCDPTLLTQRDFLEKIAEDNVPSPGILVYALDAHGAASRVADIVRSKRRLENVDLHLLSSHTAGLTVGSWIAGFRDADFVVTDSFHGTVMAIMFEKPFVTLANAERGLDRFLTLLERVGLSERLVLSEEDHMLPSIISDNINYDPVRQRIRDFRNASLLRLKTALSG